MKLKELDVVRTRFGTIAVVNRVESGRVSLVLPSTSKQKFAWYEPEELEFVAPLKDLVVDRVFVPCYSTHILKHKGEQDGL